MLVPLFAFAPLFVQPVQDSHLEVQLQHVKPAYFMRVEWKKLQNGLLPKDFEDKCKVSTDNDRNMLILDGPKEELQQAKDVISFFDVAPAKVSLSLTASNPAEGESFTSDATVDNTTSWHTESDALRISVTLTPRINDDGTITVQIAERLLVGKDSGSISIARLRDGKKVNLDVPLSAPAHFSPGTSSKNGNMIQLHIAADISTEQGKRGTALIIRGDARKSNPNAIIRSDWDTSP